MGLAVAVLCNILAWPALAAMDDKAAAKAHYEAATRLYDVHEYGEALKEYKAGYLSRPDPSFLFNIGQCYKRLGMPEQAREFFREYLKKAAPADPNRAQAEARIREIDSAPVTPAAAPPAPSTPSVAPDAEAVVPSATVVSFSAAKPTQTIGTDPAGVDLSTSSADTRDGSRPTFYRTWWFWSGVGAAVVAGTVTAVLLSRGSDGGLSAPGTTLGTRKVLQ